MTEPEVCEPNVVQPRLVIDITTERLQHGLVGTKRGVFHTAFTGQVPGPLAFTFKETVAQPLPVAVQCMRLDGMFGT